MSTSSDTSITLTLDTTEGLEQFLGYVEEVLFAALSYEVDAREVAALDPTHESVVDTLAESFHTLYGTVRTDIAAAAERGGMTVDEAMKLQADYDTLTSLRDQLRDITLASPSVTAPSQQPATAWPQSKSEKTFDANTERRRKTLTVAAEADDGVVPIKHAALPKPRPKTSLPQRSRPALHHRPSQPASRTTRQPAAGAQSARSTPEKSATPLLSFVSDRTIKAQLAAYPQPKQLEHRVRALIDREEARQTDRVAQWLGDTQTHTFSYLKNKDVSTVYGLAALPITELRTVLAPHHVRPEAFLHWVQYIGTLQEIYPGTTTSTAGEIVVTALCVQLLDHDS